MNKRGLAVSLIIVLLLVLDQWLKIYVKTGMSLGEQIPVLGHWFSLHYIENNGIAFGMVFWTRPIGKVLLTLFRMLAAAGILWVIHRMIHHPKGSFRIDFLYYFDFHRCCRQCVGLCLLRTDFFTVGIFRSRFPNFQR